MSNVRILVVPDPLLTQKCQKVDTIDDETKKLIKNLKDTLESAKDPEGVGLAAPQIGVLQRVCVVKRFVPDPANPHQYKSEIIPFINPKVVEKSRETTLGWEGCLSIPDTYGKVERHKKIKVKTLSEDGEELKIKADGFFARVIQHEMDHLEGVLFTTKVVGETLTEEELDELLKEEEGVFEA